MIRLLYLVLKYFSRYKKILGSVLILVHSAHLFCGLWTLDVPLTIMLFLQGTIKQNKTKTIFTLSCIFLNVVNPLLRDFAL